MYIINPHQRMFVLRGRFVTSVAHNDPGTGDGSNTTLFRRQKHVVPRRDRSIPTAETVRRVVQTQPVPDALVDLVTTLNTTEFLAVAFTARFILLYNSKDGAGLFSGVERYSMLETRLRHNAVRGRSAFDFWGGLVRDLNAGLTRTQDDALNALLTMPPALTQLVLDEIARNSASCVMLGRAWYEARALNHVAVELREITFDSGSDIVVSVPAISANSIRHEMLREPGMWYLLNVLDLSTNDLDPGAAALLYNGGDMYRAPEHNAFALARQICQAYPILGLLGGATGGFILGTSHVHCHAWLRCAENNDALEPLGMATNLSAFDLLDRAEHTRHNGGVVETSPMIYGMETLAKGAEIVVRLSLTPYATDLEIGALAAAIDTYVNADSTLYGQAAKGYGSLRAEYVQMPTFDLGSMVDAYADYLRANADTLRAGLLDGTLTTSSKVV